MRLAAVLVAISVLGACVQPPITLDPTPSALATTTNTPSATPSPVPTRAPIAGVPVGAILSPDGKYLAATDQNASTFKLLGLDGTVVRQASGFFNQLQWLPDSSGLFFASSAPQRAGPLGIVEVDGRVTHTELQLADTVVSPDGRTIAAEHQEGCCASIIQREIRVSPRVGGPARVLVRSTMPPTMTQPTTILGVARDGRILYRDGARIALVGFDGSRAEDLRVPDALDASRLLTVQPAPDGAAIVMRTYDPITWWLFADGAIRPLPTGVEPVTSQRREMLWVRNNELLVRATGGSLGALDVVTHGVRTFPVTLPAPTSPIPMLPLVWAAVGVGHGKLLWMDGTRLRISDLTTGRVEDGRLAVSDPAAVRAEALPGGGFLVLTQQGAYRVEAGP